MENASKALIIAGAILLAIIIISLGIMVVNNARNQIGGNDLSKQEIEAFNSQWDQYCGVSKSAAQVRSVFSAVVANNAAETQSGKSRYVNFSKNSSTPNTVALTSAPTLTSPEVSEVNNSKTFDITADYGSNGLVVNIRYVVHN